VKKKSVLHIVEELRIGGLEKIIYDLATKMNTEKYTVTVWCIARGGEIAEELIRAGIDVRILGINSYYNPFNIIRMAKFIGKHNPDILHSHTYFSNTIGRIAGRLANVPVIITHVHNTYFNYSIKNLLIERVLSFFTDKIICCSKAVRDFVLKHEKIKIQKTVVIHNGINLRKFHEGFNGVSLRKSFKISDDAPVIITVASLTEKKGHKFLLKAITSIKKRYRNIKVLIVGDGPLEHELKKIARDYNLRNSVIFAGQRNDIPELLKISDIFVLPSLQEGFPLAVIEAMSTGLPVVATSVGGVPEVIEHGETGLLIPLGNPEALSDAIMILLKDEKIGKEIGRQGQKVISENFVSDKMVAEIDQLYSACIMKKEKNSNKVLFPLS